VNKRTQELSNEELLGVIWSDAIRHGLGLGYGLVITSGRIFGAKKHPWLTANVVLHLGPGSKATQAERARAQEAAAELIAEKEFELPKESVVKILYKAPGHLSRGHLILSSTDRKIELKLSSLANMAISLTIRPLIISLIQFSPDRFYDETTGELITTLLSRGWKAVK